MGFVVAPSLNGSVVYVWFVMSTQWRVCVVSVMRVTNLTVLVFELNYFPLTLIKPHLVSLIVVIITLR